MITQLIINRTEDWFVFDDIQNDSYYLSIVLLEKLSKRPKKGIKYNRLTLIKELARKSNVNMLSTLDQAILLLSSRSLIEVKTNSKNMETILLISKKGTEEFQKFRKEHKDVFKKN